MDKQAIARSSVTKLIHKIEANLDLNTDEINDSIEERQRKKFGRIKLKNI